MTYQIDPDITANYLWLVIVGGLVGFFAAMGIGANDVANAFATSVGSKALKITHAIIIAAIMEPLGAILMGSHVTDTIRKGITKYECFQENPPILMFGCICVLISVGIWLFLASYFEMPVSTTHSVVGGMIGMTWVTGGFNCVNWYEPSDTFPYVGGVSGIILSWVISPIFSGLLAMALFATMRVAILRRKNSFDRAFWSFPVFVGITIALNIFLIVYKGAKGTDLNDFDDNILLGISLGCGLGGGLIIGLLIIPFIPKIKNNILISIGKKEKKEQQKKQELEMRVLEDQMTTSSSTSSLVDTVSGLNVNDVLTGHDGEEKLNTEKFVKSVEKTQKDTIIIENRDTKKRSVKSKLGMNDPLNYDIEDDYDDDTVRTIHANVERFDPKTEESFRPLQVFSAIIDSFSHGANDVANAIGPFAAIFAIYQASAVLEESEMGYHAYWILAIGGIGITAGLAAYGYKIIRAIGVKLCAITPSRGVAIELSSAAIIIIGSRLGIPLSTTHCQIGATMGVASLEDLKKCSGLNGHIVWKTMLGWVVTLIAVGGTSALLTAFAIYAPSIGTIYPNITGLNQTTTMI